MGCPYLLTDIHTRLYAQALVPQLVHPLLPGVGNAAPTHLKISSAHALATIVDECAPRMHQWKGTILEGVGKCWVTVVDRGSNEIGQTQKTPLFFRL